MRNTKRNNRTLVLVTLAFATRVSGTVEWLLQSESESESDTLNMLLVTSSSACDLQVDQSWASRRVNVIKTCQTYSSLPEFEDYFTNAAVLWESQQESETETERSLGESETESNVVVANTLLLPGSCHQGNNTCLTQAVVTD